MQVFSYRSQDSKELGIVSRRLNRGTGSSVEKPGPTSHSRALGIMFAIVQPQRSGGATPGRTGHAGIPVAYHRAPRRLGTK